MDSRDISNSQWFSENKSWNDATDILISDSQLVIKEIENILSKL